MREPWLIAVCAAVFLATACSEPLASSDEHVRKPTEAGSQVVRGIGPPATKAPRDGLLAFSGGNPDLHAVYTVRPDGSKPRRLPLPAALGPTTLAWSPDGKRIAFAADDLPAHQDSNLYVVGAHGRGLRQLTHGLLGVGDLAWSPDGRWIAFTGFPDDVPAAFVIRANGTGLRRVLPRFDVTSLAWGPAGRLAFAGVPSPAPASWRGLRAIWTVNVNGTHARRVVGPLSLPPALGSILAVTGWSPDGHFLLIQGAPRYGDISVVPVIGGHPRVILHCPFQTCTVVPGQGMGSPPRFKRDVDNLAWSPDGRTIIFTVGFAAAWRMYTVSADGGRMHPLSIPRRPASIGGIAWQPAASMRGRPG